jgi:hypothetical protein
VSAKDNRTMLFLENGDMISMNEKIKRLVACFGNFVYQMHNSKKMVACTFCRIKGFKYINSRCILRKWKKAKELPVMIRRPKAGIPELVMQRQSPMDTREKNNRKC